MNPKIEELIQMAIDASKKSIFETGKTTPTPHVGAAILFPDGRIETAYRGELKVGEHAEYTLLERKLKDVDLSECILASTLEPCTKRGEGKTPCCQRVIDRKIKQVYIGLLDPNPDIYNCGCRKLKNENIEVSYFDTRQRDATHAINSDFMELFSRNQALEGQVHFDYERNNSTFNIGHGDFEFSTHWSTGGASQIYCYNHNFLITPAHEKEIHEIKQADILDYTRRSILLRNGEIVIGRNRANKYIAIKIIEVIPRGLHEPSCVLRIKYKITASPIGDFSANLAEAYQVERIAYSEAWALATVEKVVRLELHPFLAPIETLQSKIASLGFSMAGAHKPWWHQVGVRYNDASIVLVRDHHDYKTFRVTISRINQLEETISRELKETLNFWQVDLRLDMKNGSPERMQITRIVDQTTNGVQLVDLPAVDIKQYF